MNQDSESKLALFGGAPVITDDLRPSLPIRWEEEEVAAVTEVLKQRSLFYWNGAATGRMIEAFKELYPLQYVMPVSSGSAAIHTAILSIGLQPGDEVITSPITDQGTVIGVLYQQGVPVFADVDARTYNLDPESVERAITPRTKAIIAVHLAGAPCDMLRLREIADRHGLVLIEDCAQAWGTLYDGKPVGTLGDIGCFSLNDFKHISCGDGGIVATNNPAFGVKFQRCADKAYDRVGGVRFPESLAPCYRITELQAAVASVQLRKVQRIAARRNELGSTLTRLLEEIPGILPPIVRPNDYSSYWFYLFRIDLETLRCTLGEFVEALNKEGVAAGAGYIPAPLYRYPVFQNHNFFGGQWPIKALGLTRMDYREVCCPNAELVLQTSVKVEVREAMPDAHIQRVARGIRKVASYYAKLR